MIGIELQIRGAGGATWTPATTDGKPLQYRTLREAAQAMADIERQLGPGLERLGARMVGLRTTGEPEPDDGQRELF